MTGNVANETGRFGDDAHVVLRILGVILHVEPYPCPAPIESKTKQASTSTFMIIIIIIIIIM